MTTGERIMKLEEQMQSHADENNSHFLRIEKSQDVLGAKIDKFVEVTNTKADRTAITALEETKANKEDLKELRGWVIGGILISIFLMVISLMLKG